MVKFYWDWCLVLILVSICQTLGKGTRSLEFGSANCVLRFLMRFILSYLAFVSNVTWGALASSGSLYHTLFSDQEARNEAFDFGRFACQEYDPSKKQKIIYFIKRIREGLGVDPNFTADARYLYSDLEFSTQFFSTQSYSEKLGRFFTLTDSQKQVVATVGFVERGAGVCELKKFYLDPPPCGAWVSE